MDSNVPVESMRLISALCERHRRVRLAPPPLYPAGPVCNTAACSTPPVLLGRSQVLALEPTSVAKCSRALTDGVFATIATPNRFELLTMAASVLNMPSVDPTLRVRPETGIGRPTFALRATDHRAVAACDRMRLQEWLAPRLQRPEAANDARILRHCCHLLSNIFPVLAVKLGSDGVMLCTQDETGAPYVTVYPRTPAVRSDVRVGCAIVLTSLAGWTWPVLCGALAAAAAPSSVVSVTGAGDTFTAALTFALLEVRGCPSAHRCE